MKKQIIWGSIPIKGLESEEDMKKYSIKNITLIENGKIGAEKMKNLSKEKRKEYADRAIKVHTGKKRNDETKKKLSVKAMGRISPRKGKTHTEESKQKLSKTITGHKHTEEAKEKMRKPRLNTEGYKRPKNKIECPHCGMMAQPTNAYRWHFDNCKRGSNTMGG
jgi:hypothetical protein